MSRGKRRPLVGILSDQSFNQIPNKAVRPFHKDLTLGVIWAPALQGLSYDFPIGELSLQKEKIRKAYSD